MSVMHNIHVSEGVATEVMDRLAIPIARLEKLIMDIRGECVQEIQSSHSDVTEFKNELDSMRNLMKELDVAPRKLEHRLSNVEGQCLALDDIKNECKELRHLVNELGRSVADLTQTNKEMALEMEQDADLLNEMHQSISTHAHLLDEIRGAVKETQRMCKEEVANRKQATANLGLRIEEANNRYDLVVSGTSMDVERAIRMIDDMKHEVSRVKRDSNEQLNGVSEVLRKGIDAQMVKSEELKKQGDKAAIDSEKVMQTGNVNSRRIDKMEKQLSELLREVKELKVLAEVSK